MIAHLRELFAEYSERLPELADRYRTSGVRHAYLAEAAEHSVANWEWTALPRYELEPFYFELGECRRGRVMRKPPDVIAGRHQYGFSSTNVLIMERDHVERPGQFYECFYEYFDREISKTRFSYDREKSIINCSRMLHEMDDVMCFQSWATGGYAQHIYVLRAGHVIWRLTSHHPVRRKPFGGVTSIEHLDGGAIQVWAIDDDHRRTLAYQGPSVDNGFSPECIASTRFGFHGAA
jgi:hypothetical protein